MPPLSAATKKLGERLREHRTSRELTREYVAAETGQDISTIQRAETGATDIKVSTLILIADALGTRPAELLDGITKDLIPPRVPRSANRQALKTRRRGPQAR